MEKRLKIGLYFMVAAVVLMPVAIFMKTNNETATVIMLIFTMFLELVGLIFVILSILKKRNLKGR